MWVVVLEVFPHLGVLCLGDDGWVQRLGITGRSSFHINVLQSQSSQRVWGSWVGTLGVLLGTGWAGMGQPRGRAAYQP